MFLPFLLFPVFFSLCQIFQRNLASFSLVSSVTIDDMPWDVGRWTQCVIWWAVQVPVPHVVHAFRSLNLTKDAAYQVLLALFIVVAPFGVFYCLVDAGAVWISDPLPISVTGFASLGDFWTAITM